MEHRIKNLRKFPRLDAAKLAFRNRHDLTFSEAGREWGFDQAGVAHGMALADLDNDGDLDVVVNNLNQAVGVYRNESGAPRVAVRLKGLAPNTHGIGAKVWLYGGAVPVQSQEMICGGRYLSSDDAMRVFAAGSPTNDMRLEVKWRGGRRSVVNGVKANRIYEVDEAGATIDPSSNKRSNIQHPTSNIQHPTGGGGSNSQLSTLNSQPLFEDASQLIQHAHH